MNNNHTEKDRTREWPALGEIWTFDDLMNFDLQAQDKLERSSGWLDRLDSELIQAELNPKSFMTKGDKMEALREVSPDVWRTLKESRPGAHNGKKQIKDPDKVVSAPSADHSIGLPGSICSRIGVFAPNIMTFRRPPENDSSTLLGDRFLCRGGGALLVGPTGIGKSSLQMQMAISFSLGKECFGIKPNGLLRSVIIQAENDDGDMAEMRDGVINGMNLSREEIDHLNSGWEAVSAFHETSLRGEALVREVVAPLCKMHAPDLVWIDPALSYMEGEPSSASDVGHFLRSLINPTVKGWDCGVIIVAHTAKPPRTQQSTWTAGDNAYSTLGSVEWANWARGVITISNIGNDSIFRLSVPKRGKRLGWQDAFGQETSSRLIAHSEKGICWRDASEEEVESLKAANRAKAGVNAKYSQEEILNLLSSPLTPGEWKSNAAAKTGISAAAFNRIRKELLDDGKAEKVNGHYQKVSQSKSHETKGD